MRNLLLIDGENFVHGILHNLSKQDIIKRRSQLKRFNPLVVADDIANFEKGDIHYFTTKISLPPKDHPLFKKAEAMRQWNAKWVPFLSNRGVKFISAGMLKVRDGRRCDHCGKKTEILLEKGVDVRLGVDIATADSKTNLFVFSSDSDLIPAFLAAKSKGVKVAYVAIDGQVNRALSKAASKTIIINNKTIK